jgi:hypothetical protein
VRAHDGKAYLGISVNELTFMGGGQGRHEDSSGQSHESGGQSGGSFDDEIPF